MIKSIATYTQDNNTNNKKLVKSNIINLSFMPDSDITVDLIKYALEIYDGNYHNVNYILLMMTDEVLKDKEFVLHIAKTYPRFFIENLNDKITSKAYSLKEINKAIDDMRDYSVVVCANLLVAYKYLNKIGLVSD